MSSKQQASDQIAAWRMSLIQLLQAAADELVDEMIPIADRIHDIRKAAKQSRALLKLAPGHLRSDARKLRQQLRTLRKLFGDARDARVSLDLLEHFSSKSEASNTSLISIQSKLTRNCAMEEASITAAIITDAVDRLNTCIAKAESWTTDGADENALVEHVVNGYRAARRLLPEEGASLERLHAFRSAIVDHRYQMAFLAENGPRLVKERARTVQNLRESLGD